jgi:hypothetical protein
MSQQFLVMVVHCGVFFRLVQSDSDQTQTVQTSTALVSPISELV